LVPITSSDVDGLHYAPLVPAIVASLQRV